MVSAAAFIVKSCSSSGPSTDRRASAGVRLSPVPGLAKVKTYVAPVPSGSPAIGPSKVSLVGLPRGERCARDLLKAVVLAVVGSENELPCSLLWARRLT